MTALGWLLSNEQTAGGNSENDTMVDERDIGGADVALADDKTAEEDRRMLDRRGTRSLDGC